jgi:hypothetical protein
LAQERLAFARSGWRPVQAARRLAITPDTPHWRDGQPACSSPTPLPGLAAGLPSTP